MIPAGLIISRERDAQIILFDRVGAENQCTAITAVDIKGECMRIGINAPRERYGVVRSETIHKYNRALYKKIAQGENLTPEDIGHLDGLVLIEKVFDEEGLVLV